MITRQKASPDVQWDFDNPFIFPVTVQAGHIDGLHHANNAAYVSWCQEAGWRHSKALGLTLNDYRHLDIAMAIRHAEYDYIAAAYEGERLLVGTWLTLCDGRLSMERRFQVVRERGGQLLLRAVWQLVSIRLSTGRAARMPQVFRDIYGPTVVEATSGAR